MPCQEGQAEETTPDRDQTMYAIQTLIARGYYNRALTRGRLRKARSIITGESRRLDDLHHIPSSQIKSRYSEPGTKTVQIDQIRGSGGRVRDFDRDFNPRQTHTRDRWHAVARLQLEGRELPPIDLVHVGDRYFVRDGHHRVSVAHLLGQRDIEAKVTVWQIEGPLPWQRPERQNNPVRRFASAIRTLAVQAALTIAATRKRAPNAMCTPEASGCAD
jgi:hypothetical protein